eukprot:SAG31_NODE_2482_length_5634_cov_1.887805_5_plen_81_part_00
MALGLRFSPRNRGKHVTTAKPDYAAMLSKIQNLQVNRTTAHVYFDSEFQITYAPRPTQVIMCRLMSLRPRRLEFRALKRQ